MMYLRLAALAAFLGVAALALWFRGNAISAEAESRAARAQLTAAIEANRMMKDALDRATELRKQTDAILADIHVELRSIHEAADEENAAIDRLENDNEAVRNYLNTPIPDDLRRLLNPG